MLVFRIVNSVHNVEGLSTTQKAVLTTLAHCANNPEGKDIYPGLDYIARKSCMHEKTARRALAELIKNGWLKEEPGRKGHLKVYAICLEKLGINPSDIKPIKKGVQPQPSASSPAPEEPRAPYEQGLPAAASSAPSTLPEEEEQPAPSGAMEQLRKVRAARRAAALQAARIE